MGNKKQEVLKRALIRNSLITLLTGSLIFLVTMPKFFLALYDLLFGSTWLMVEYAQGFLVYWMHVASGPIIIVLLGTWLFFSRYHKGFLFLLIPFSLLVVNILFFSLAALLPDMSSSEWGGLAEVWTAIFFNIAYLVFSIVYSVVLFVKRKA